MSFACSLIGEWVAPAGTRLYVALCRACSWKAQPKEHGPAYCAEDELCTLGTYHGVVVHGDVTALGDACIAANSGSRGLDVLQEAAGGGQETSSRVLGIDTCLHCPPMDFRRLSARGSPRSGQLARIKSTGAAELGGSVLSSPSPAEMRAAGHQRPSASPLQGLAR